jgi:hypothetical protein
MPLFSFLMKIYWTPSFDTQISIKIKEVQLKYKSFKHAHLSRTIWKPTFINLTNITEVRAFIGLLNLAGLLKSNHENWSSLWASDGTGRDIFRCTMTLPL